MRLLILLLSLTATSCANYQFGDISTRYCNSEKPEIRLALKAVILASGVEVGVDYCTTKGLVDILASTDINE